jgi:Tfp pilus assembly protein PilV
MKSTSQTTNHAKAGMSLVETCVAMFLVTACVSAVLTGIVQAARLNYSTAQHVAAYNLCKDVLEQMRGAKYSTVTADVYTNEVIRLTHLGGRPDAALHPNCTMTELTDPGRKVEVVTTGNSGNRPTPRWRRR